MPPRQTLITQWVLKVNDQVATEMMVDVKRIEVDSNLFMPDMCTVELNRALTWMSTGWIGRSIKIEAGDAPGEGGVTARQQAKPIFAGEVVAVEGDFREDDHNFLIVRAYDRSHRMQHATKARHWTQVTDSDLATRIGGEYGLEVQTDPTKFVHVQIFQDNVTDFEFISERARASGRIFTIDAGKLLFRKADNLGKPTVELDLGATMLEFHPRFTVGAQVQDVTVRGWDVKAKREVLGQARAGLSIAKGGGEGKTGAQLYGPISAAGTYLVTDQVIDSQPQGDEVAGSVLNDIWASDFRADGIAMGNPDLQAGGKVKITNMDKFNGEYFVTSVRHVYDGGHYLSHFNISGLSADTTADLVGVGKETGKTMTGRTMQGLAIAIVSDNKDPEKMGRVKVYFPWFDAGQQSDWVRMATPMTGGGRGFYFTPEVRDEVLVGFEHGDFNRPYIIGGLWNGQDATPIPASDAVDGQGKVNKRIIKTRAGHILRFDDTSGGEKIEIIDKTGKNKIVIDSTSNKITIEAFGDIDLKATKDVNIKGINVNIQGSGRTVIKGATVEIN